MVRDALDCGASMGKPPFLLGIIVEEKMLLDFDGTWGITPAGATKGLSDRPLETFGAATFGVICGCMVVLLCRIKAH